MLKIIGGLLIVWGMLDFALSLTGTDLYAEIGIAIPYEISTFTGYIVAGIGFFLFSVGQKRNENGNENDEDGIESNDQSEMTSRSSENGIFDISTRCEFSVNCIQDILYAFIADKGMNSTHVIYTISEKENIYV